MAAAGLRTTAPGPLGNAPARRRKPLRILIASHSHPEISNGGAEISAFQLFQGLGREAGETVWFLGCDRQGGADRAGAVIAQPFSDHEYIYNCGDFDWFRFANRDANFPAEIIRLFTELAPDVVHFHHFINFGVEVFLHLRRALPGCRIILTLHEYLAICNHFGQMVTSRHRNLCHESSASRCQQCFPELARSDFFLRRRYIERFFSLVDAFVSPSEFLAERYASWGLELGRLSVLENLMPESAATAPVPPPSDGPLRIGFFGQISALKGINVLFDAAASLANQDVNDVTLEIFGDYSGQPEALRQDFLERLEKRGGNVRFHGPYDRTRVDGLMRSVNAVLVPSVWWENSPVVIQEALRNRRPVICSDIGGMAEKVRDGVDGFHFPVGNSVALATLLRRLASDRTILSRLTERLPGHAALHSTVEDYRRLYDQVLSWAPRVSQT